MAELASVAFRRPLTDEENKLYRDVLFAEAANPEAAVRWAVLLILKSASFLYTDLPTDADVPVDYTVASRLSFALWDSIPDEALIKAARDAKLETADEIESQARRMIDDPRTRSKMRRFFKHWLELEERDLAKDKDMFPGFDETTISDLRRSLDLFLDQVLWSDDSDYRQLLLADYLVLNASLLDLYRPDDGDALSVNDFEPVILSPGRRAGVLTHPYLLSAFAYHNNTSPIHRGVFLTRNIMGRGLKPPPIAVAFKDEEFAPDFTMREKITKLTGDKVCMACHSVINPLGFALENFDAVGRWRTRDNNKPVDPKSEYVSENGETLEVRSARDIADFAASNESAQKAFVIQIFHHLIKQSPYAYGANTANQLRNKFAENSFNIQSLLSEIAVITATHGQAEITVNEPKP